MKLILFLSFFNFADPVQEHATVVNQSLVYTIHEDQTAEIEESYTLRINSEQGHRYAVFYEYIDQFRKLTDVSIEVLNKNGQKVKKLRKIDGFELGFNPSYEINDGKTFILDPDFKDYPFTIVVKSRIKVSGFISLPTWVPRPYFNMGVEHAELTVIRHRNIVMKLREEHLQGNHSSTEEYATSKYVVSNLPAIESKMRYKDFYEEQPKVFVVPAKFQLDEVAGSNLKWEDFGEWFLTLNNKPYNLKAKTRRFIDSLDKHNPAEVIQKVYEYMQDKTRYVSIQFGIGGFQSLPTEEVEEFGYGDCKALSTYMRNMLDYAGIKSNYILVRAGKDVPEVIADFASNQFNHVFIGVPLPLDTIFLECTSQISPVNHTGTFTDDRNVLWVEKGNSSIIRSKVYPFTKNVQTKKVKASLDKLGNSTLKYTIQNEGIFFDEIMLYKLAPEDYVKEHNEEKFDFHNFLLKNFKYSQPERNNASFISEFVVEVPNYAKLVNDKMIVPMHNSSLMREYVDTDERMKYFSISRGLTVTEELDLIVPENHWVGTLPKSEKITSPYGSYELTVEANSSTITIRKKIILKKGDYTKEKYDDFKILFDQIEKIEKRQLILNSKT